MSVDALSEFGTSNEDLHLASLRFGESKINQVFPLTGEIRNDLVFTGIVGQSAALRQVLQLVEIVAASDATVLLLGETGTGKELIARAIHERSQRQNEKFVTLNCAAIPGPLFESELFGHERGAFTGAHMRRVGRLELADRGTLFLDEVGDMPLEMQPKFLRALQERAYERVGSAQTKSVNVRLVAATHRNLEKMMAEKQFRNDLYYRLNVFPIHIPPLRERREDIPMLVQHFTRKYARRMGKHIATVPAATIEKLQRWHWPGNVRELENLIERSVIVCETENFSVDESWLSQQPLRTSPTTQRELRQRVAAEEKEAIEAALTESRGRVFGPSGAAAKLGIARSTLDSKIKTLKIDKNRFKVSSPS